MLRNRRSLKILSSHKMTWFRKSATLLAALLVTGGGFFAFEFFTAKGTKSDWYSIFPQVPNSLKILKIS